MSLRIVFRADASVTLGQGHVMRCLALAHELREQGAFCSFLCAELPGNLIGVIQDKGFAVQRLNAVDLGDWAADARASRAALEDENIDWIIVDHYALDERWERQLRDRATHLMVIDDLADRRHDCELLLDQNPGREAKDYQDLLPASCQRLLGPSFALLREEFRQQASQRRPLHGVPVQKLLISMGGTDADNLTGKTISILENAPTGALSKVTVILGAQAPWVDALRRQAAQSRLDIDIVISPDRMSEIMANADLAIGAAGVSALERCCIGLPSLLVIAADNQRPGALALHALGAAHCLGEADAFDSALRALIDQGFFATPHQMMSDRARAIVDGDGCARVAFALTSISLNQHRANDIARCELSTSAGKLRPIGEPDLRLILAWRNHPDIRRHMRHRDLLSWEEHLRWFQRKQSADELPNLFEIDGLPMGFVQFDATSTAGTIEWGFYLAPDTPKGMGKRLGAAALAHAFAQKHIDCIIGQVLPDNLRSLRFHERLGFQRMTSEAGSPASALISYRLDRAEWTRSVRQGELHEVHH